MFLYLGMISILVVLIKTMISFPGLWVLFPFVPLLIGLFFLAKEVDNN